MFCKYCGAALNDKAKFCKKCGKKLLFELNDSFEQDGLFFDIDLFGRTYKYYGVPFMCTTFLESFNEQLKIFNGSLVKRFNTKINSMSAVSEYGFPCFIDEYEEMIKLLHLALMTYKVDYITPEELHDIVNEKCDFDKWFEPIFIAFGSLDNVLDEIESKRNIQRSSRIRWSGGGFGFKGAIKGAVGAAVMNAGTSFIRRIGDGIIDRSDKEYFENIDRNTYRRLEPLRIFSTNALRFYNRIIITFYELIWEKYGKSLNSPMITYDGIKRYDDIYGNYYIKYKSSFSDQDGKLLKDAIIKRIEYFPLSAYPYFDLCSYLLLDFNNVEMTIDKLHQTEAFKMMYLDHCKTIEKKVFNANNLSGSDAKFAMEIIDWFKTSNYYNHVFDKKYQELKYKT